MGEREKPQRDGKLHPGASALDQLWAWGRALRPLQAADDSLGPLEVGPGFGGKGVWSGKLWVPRRPGSPCHPLVPPGVGDERGGLVPGDKARLGDTV